MNKEEKLMNKEEKLIQNDRINAFFEALPTKIDDILKNEDPVINLNNNNNPLNLVIIILLIIYLIYLFCN